MLDDGTLAGYIDELSVTGLTSNPTIFDKAIGDGKAYDEQIAELSGRGLEGEALFFELALTDLRRAAALFSRRPRAHRRRRRPRLARGLAAARRRRRGDDRPGGRALRPRRGELLHQDPRHRGRAQGDRGDDLRRHPGQRDAAVLDRAVPRRRRRLHARDRAPDRGRAEPRRRLGRVAVHQPLGRGARERRRSPGRASQPSSGSPSARHAYARLPRAARLRPLRSGSRTRARARSGC